MSLLPLLIETPLFQELTHELVRELTQQTRLDTLRAALLRQVERRLGPVPDDLHQQLQQVVDPEQLNQLFDAAVDSPSLEAFRSHIR